MRKWFKYALCAFLIILLVGWSGIGLTNFMDEKSLERIYKDGPKDIEPVVFLHFFDWFFEDSWIEGEFVDKLLWKELGIVGEDRKSEEFYYKQFVYMKSLGIDALAWEYHPRKGGVEPLYLSENAIKALERAGLKVAPFFDFEVAIKVEQSDDLIPTLSQSGSIAPNQETVDYILRYIEQFYRRVPEKLWACDGKGRTVIYVYGYDFNDDSQPEEWNDFAESLVNKIQGCVKNEPAFYWTYKNSSFAEHLFLKHRENFIPFQFVLDTPQGQFGHDSVTWNMGFDNLGVQVRDGLKRVIRLDERYIKEMGL